MLYLIHKRYGSAIAKIQINQEFNRLVNACVPESLVFNNLSVDLLHLGQ